MKVSKKDKRLLDGIVADLFDYEKQLFADKVEEEVAKARELSIDIENSLRNSFNDLLAKSKEEFAIADIDININLMSAKESQARANYVATAEFMELKFGDKKEAEAEDEIKNEKEKEE